MYSKYWALIRSQLGLYDIVNTPGVAADLSHISTPAKVEGYLPPDGGLERALKGAEIVVIPAGVPRKPGVRPSIRSCVTYPYDRRR
jgi:malate dehydrogenase